jgi:hypothetical protein
LLAHGWWFSPASSTTKTGRHEILLKVALSTIKSNQILKMRGDCFVDIGGIDDHHCLNFLFKNDRFL